jgi:hypothetical protein
MSAENGLSPTQEVFDHYFGIFAGIASITGLILGLRALMKEKEYEKKFGLLAPLLEEEGLGAVPKYETLKQLDMSNPEKPKKKEKKYHTIVKYYLCDDYTTNKLFYDKAKKHSKNFSFYCELPAHRSHWAFPPIDGPGMDKKNAKAILRLAKKQLQDNRLFGGRIIIDKRGKSKLF